MNAPRTASCGLGLPRLQSKPVNHLIQGEQIDDDAQVVAVLPALAVGTTFITEAFAQADPNQLIAARKSAMVLHGEHFGRTLAMVFGAAPYDVAAVQRKGDFLAVQGQLP